MQLVHRGTSAPRPVATPTSSRGMPRDLSEAQWPVVSEVEPTNHSPPVLSSRLGVFARSLTNSSSSDYGNRHLSCSSPLPPIPAVIGLILPGPRQ